MKVLTTDVNKHVGSDELCCGSGFSGMKPLLGVEVHVLQVLHDPHPRVCGTRLNQESRV